MVEQANSKLKLRLGNLLIASKFSSVEKIEHAASFAKLGGIPLGKALSFLEYVDAQKIEDVLNAQQLALESSISHEEAIFVLQTANRFDLRFAQALEICFVKPEDNYSTKFGSLLKMQGVSPSKINMALRIAKKSGKQIGQVAMQIGAISKERNDYTFKIQKTIRSLDAPLLEPCGNKKNSFCRIGELLTRAQCINEKMLDKALDEKDFAGQRLGTYLLSQNLINDSLLHLALSLQNLVRSGLLNIQSAVCSLRNFALDQSQMTIGQFLTICNYYDSSDEENLISMLEQNASLYKEILKALTSSEMAEYCDSGMLLKLACRNVDVMRLLLHLLRPEEQNLIDSAIVFYSLAQDKKMTMSQALINCIVRKSQASNRVLRAA